MGTWCTDPRLYQSLQAAIRLLPGEVKSEEHAQSHGYLDSNQIPLPLILLFCSHSFVLIAQPYDCFLTFDIIHSIILCVPGMAIEDVISAKMVYDRWEVQQRHGGPPGGGNFH